MLIQILGGIHKGPQVLKMVGSNHRGSIGVVDDGHQP